MYVECIYNHAGSNYAKVCAISMQYLCNIYMYVSDCSKYGEDCGDCYVGGCIDCYTTGCVGNQIVQSIPY